ncbi:MAG: hypothetical protein H0U21_17885 [Acidimicrobiia bacterium]|nr:hypothetical protein [Acidimicrobiia bacterium]
MGHTHRDSFAVSHGVTGDVTAFGIVIELSQPGRGLGDDPIVDAMPADLAARRLPR